MDSINERIKMIRDSLGLNQEDFGLKLGLTKPAISGYETGRRTPSEAILLSICRVFNIDYIWLTTGEGDMFVDYDTELISVIDNLMATNKTAKKTFKAFAKLDIEDWEVIEKIIDIMSNDNN